MRFEGWYLLLGALMLAVTLLDRLMRRLPITTTIVYLVGGVMLGPLFLGLMVMDPVTNSGFLERVTEVAVIVSLFTAGLKLRAPFSASRWRLPVLLAFISMGLTVAGLAAAAVVLLNMPIGAAILLGAILAPTDPVLASDVQLEHPGDRDLLRFSLTGEAGLNDGTAFPFVMLGLGLLGLHGIGDFAWRWATVDFVWAISAALVIGAILGTLVGRLVVYLRTRHEETVGRDVLIGLGLIGVAYGAAIFAHAYGFLAVFACGVAVRRIEMQDSAQRDSNGRENLADDRSESVPQTLASSVLQANEQLERILEIGLVLLLGAMLSRDYLNWNALWMAAILFLVVRPVSVALGTLGARASRLQRLLLGWFGIRGIGSLYYLMYAVERGLDKQTADTLTSLVLTIVAISVLVHGISVTPIMNMYEQRKKRREA